MFQTDFYRSAGFLVLPLALTISAQAIAGTATDTSSPFDGVSIGLAFGGDTTTIKTTVPELTTAFKKTNSGGTGRFFIGYDRLISDRIVLGVEAGADSDRKLKALPSAAGIYQVKAKGAFDVTARAGYLVSRSTLLYAKVGYRRFDSDQTINFAAAGKPSVNRTVHVNSAIWGLGVEQALSDNIGARVELAAGSAKGIISSQLRLGISYRF
jgi:outer membrane immunogenic protein